MGKYWKTASSAPVGVVVAVEGEKELSEGYPPLLADAKGP